MTIFVPQRTPIDCTICCLAMALDCPYEVVMLAAGELYSPDIGGVRDPVAVLERLGLHAGNGHESGDFLMLSRPFELSPQFIRLVTWGRRAVMTVPSLNIPDGWHHVYWDGRELLDPKRGAADSSQFYTGWLDLRPEDAILFQETDEWRLRDFKLGPE